MDLNYKAIGNRIREGRELLGISQQKLGEQVGLSTTAIALYESGEREINSLAVLNNIAKNLHLSLKELIEGYEKPPVQISFRASEKALKDPKFAESIRKTIEQINEGNK